MERHRVEPDHQPAVKKRPRAGGITPRLPRLGLSLLLLAARLPHAGAATPPPATEASVAPLAREIPAFLAQPHFTKATWGIRVVQLPGEALLFETNAQRLLKPASNAKLFTAALALDALGPDHRVSTELIPTGPLRRDGTLQGDLVLRGHGDFSLSWRFHGGPRTNSLAPVVEALRGAGIRRIHGALTLDNALFQGPPFGGGWTWDDLQYWYGAPVGTLNLDDNVLDFSLRPGTSPGQPVTLEPLAPVGDLVFDTTDLQTGLPGTPRRVLVRRDPGSARVRLSGSLPAGSAPWPASVSIPEPERYFARRLEEALRHAGIPVRQGIRPFSPGTRSRRSQPALAPVSIASRPLAERVRRMLKPSQNLYAQLLLIEAGRTVAEGESGETSEARGLRAMAAFLDKVGIPADEVLLDDGSGLSRSTLTTPAAVVRLLGAMDRHPSREAFLDALPVAGIDGTLRNRLRGTAAAGNLRAKTGSLRYVNTLSGYVTNAAGHRLAFSLMINAYQPPPGAPTGREALDRVAEILALSRE